MRRTTLHTLAVCFLLGLAPATLVRCGVATDGTETGNPPVIDSLKLYLERDANGVRVVGAPGAITPGGARLTIRNVSTGESIEASASADGSLNVLIAGAPGDEYEVVASSGGQTLGLTLSFLDIALRQDLAGVSCPALETALIETLSTTYSSADASCRVDADCAYVGWGMEECYYECGETLLSVSGGVAARASAEERTASVCVALRNCDRPAASSCGGGRPFEVLECIEGQCKATDPGTLSCADLLDKADNRYDDLDDLADAADRTCTVDADCIEVDVPVPGCVTSCSTPRALARAAAAPVEDLISGGSYQGLCQELRDRSCPLPPMLCGTLLPSEALCVAGTCTVVNTPEP